MYALNYPGCRASIVSHSCSARISCGTEMVSDRIPVISALFAKYSTSTCTGENAVNGNSQAFPDCPR